MSQRATLLKLEALQQIIADLQAATTKIIVGAVDPIASQGKQGDLYYNKTTYTLFAPKGVSSWPVGVSLQGPPGPGIDQATLDAINQSIAAKVDKVNGKGLSSNDLTDLLLTAINAHLASTANPHNVTKAQVGLGNVDNTSDANKPVSGPQQTALDGKVDKVGSKQLSTEDYSTAEKAKLSGIANGATSNSPDVTLLNRANHTGAQSADTITDGTTNKTYTATEKTKLAGIAANATANDTDANLKSRANHTGTQTAATISDFATATDARITAQKGASNGLATLDSSGTVPAAQLPSYVDDVLEYAALGGFPVSGETGKIYVALDSNKTYRWSGSAYVEISASPGSTDSVAEGSTNKYFTESRVRSTVLTGLVAAVSRVAPDATDTVLTALGKFWKVFNDLKAVGFSGSAADLSGTLSAAQLPALTGDVTSTAGNASTTLATVNSSPGTYGSSSQVPILAVDGKGRVTSVTLATIPTSNPTTVTTNGSASGTVSWAWATAINVLNVTTAGNVTFANPTGLIVGMRGTLLVTIGAAGHTLSFGTAWKWANGTPSFPTTSGSVIQITLFSDGTNVYAFWENATKLTLAGYNTTDSQLKVGGLEFQSFALDNSWFGANMYNNGVDFKYRSNGKAGLFYFLGQEGQLRLYPTGTAGATASSVVQLKVYSNGTFAVGSSISANEGDFTGANLLVTGTGLTLLGTTTSDGVNRLQVNGSAKATQYRLSALNTAPASSTDTGTLGEIRVTAGFIYVCTATNTWVRSALSSW